MTHLGHRNVLAGRRLVAGICISHLRFRERLQDLHRDPIAQGYTHDLGDFTVNPLRGGSVPCMHTHGCWAFRAPPGDLCHESQVCMVAPPGGPREPGICPMHPRPRIHLPHGCALRGVCCMLIQNIVDSGRTIRLPGASALWAAICEARCVHSADLGSAPI